jgi:hypothetical protein
MAARIRCPRLPASGSGDHVIALFNATATPEREAHGAFLSAAAEHLPGQPARCSRWWTRAPSTPAGAATRHAPRNGAAPGANCAVNSSVPCAFADLAAAGADLASAAAPLADAESGNRSGACRGDPMSGAAGAIALSLISHTNAGKTTLARTLLGRDVGEVRDAPHVTTEATPYPLIETPARRRAGALGHPRLR